MSSSAFFRSKLAIVGAISYVLVFVGALLYPLFDHHTFSGLVAVLLALPWIDHLPKGAPVILLVGCAALNAAIIYLVLATLVRGWSKIRRSVKE